MFFSLNVRIFRDVHSCDFSFRRSFCFTVTFRFALVSFGTRTVGTEFSCSGSLGAALISWHSLKKMMFLLCKVSTSCSCRCLLQMRVLRLRN